MPNRRNGAKPDKGPDAEHATWSESTKSVDTAVRQELVECHRDFLAFLRRRLRNHDDAEDVLQDFMSRALSRSRDLRDAQSVRGWLSRVLATTLVDHYRRKSRRREALTDPALFDDLPMEPDLEVEAAVCFCLYRLLPTLKPTHSELIWRIDLLGEPRDRVAVSLGLTLNNVNVKLHRGRRALKTRLQEICLTCPEHGFLDCRCEEGDRIRKARHRTVVSS